MQALQCGGAKRLTGELHEFGPGASILFESASHSASHSRAVLLLDASHHHHVEVARFGDNGNTVSVEHIGYGVGNLLGKPFLYLQSPGKNIYDAGDFVLSLMILPFGR